MNFYILQEPRGQSDYEFTWINGTGGAEVYMPGVDCSVCGDTRGLPGGLLPYRLPEDMEQRLRKLDGWPIPENEHRALREEVESRLREVYPDMPPMPPGPFFPPLDWAVPSQPEGDVFWGAGLVVSARLAQALEAIDATGCVLIPIDSVKVGKGSPSDKPPIPASGEPEGLLRLATQTPEAGEQFFMLSTLAEGHLNSRMRPQPACTGCGYSVIIRGSVWKDWQVWEDSIWPGADIFHFPTTLHIVVTERIAALLKDMKIGNVVLKPLSDGALAFAPTYKDILPGTGISRWFPDWLKRLQLRRDGLD